MSIPPDLQGARVLVTGAAGFVGRHLLARLATTGADVVGLTRQDCDLTDRDAVHRAVSAASPDVLIHLAATRSHATAADRERTRTVNSLSGAWVVESLPEQCRVAVALGSSTEYDGSTGPLSETASMTTARRFFGATKAAGSLLFLATAAERGIPSRLLRAFQVYGPGDKPTRFVPTVIAAARSGAVIPLTRPGLRRDWVWVGDVVDACVRAASAEVPSGSVFNIGTGAQTTNEELVRIAERVTATTIRTDAGAHPGREWDTADWVADPSHARRELGWEPRVDLAAGLARCWAA